jgi:hypothetical protein
MSRAALLAIGAAAVLVVAALLAAGDAIAGQSGMADAGCAIAVGGLLAARGVLGRPSPHPAVRDSPRRHWKRRSAVAAPRFPGFGAIDSEISWARVARRHYDHGLRRRLARIAATKGVDAAVLTGPPCTDDNAPGPDLAELGRLISWLEEP